MRIIMAFALIFLGVFALGISIQSGSTAAPAIVVGVTAFLALVVWNWNHFHDVLSDEEPSGPCRHTNFHILEVDDSSYERICEDCGDTVWMHVRTEID